jgi:BirA family transcriptional regulator, biotin operon repressor / biotin---[acetyl-CoA-carboxylase] ligase
MSWTVDASVLGDVTSLVPLAVGLGALEAVSTLVEGAGVAVSDVELKWPNDLMAADGRKLAGILCEIVHGPSNAAVVVIGIGVNRVRPAVVEGVLAERGVWLSELGPIVEPAVLAAEVVCAATVHLDRLGHEADAFIAEYSARCSTVGRSVRCELPNSVVFGTATGVDRRGQLLVSTGHETVETISAGDVIHVRPA